MHQQGLRYDFFTQKLRMLLDWTPLHVLNFLIRLVIAKHVHQEICQNKKSKSRNMDDKKEGVEVNWNSWI